ncbi:uncharacterized protein LOC126682618 [Mercurialis annua]|uniref:uncharacterized protein LOC126682618 n=1 Tax=Mercurialis annua TaxID=3986 RepID=UPI0021605237|nr:uncharacterized protein LOC126682618 [Mercurialis annua]
MFSSKSFLHFFIFYLTTPLTLLKTFHFNDIFTLTRASLFFAIIDAIFSIFFKLCGLTSITVDIDDQTTLHFWVSRHRKFKNPNLVMIHGYGGDARWQFLYQIGFLATKFNIYMPDLVFFGKSYSNRTDRTDEFQAKCVVEGLRRLGAGKYSAYSLSYGGYVAYRMAEICGKDEMEKLVIVGSGVGWNNEDEKREMLMKIGRDAKELLVPDNPRDLRLLVKLGVFRRKPLRWVPDFVLQEFLNAMGNHHRKEKMELVEYLLATKPDSQLAILTQETLVIWGDQDNVFPVCLAYQLQRHLGLKSRVEIIKDTGHAVNIESPRALNRLITSFLLL